MNVNQGQHILRKERSRASRWALLIAFVVALLIGFSSLFVISAPAAKDESLYYTVNPGRCIIVSPQFSSQYWICNTTGKLPRSYWVPVGALVFYV